MVDEARSIEMGTPVQPFDIEDDAIEQRAVENIRKMLETQPFTVLNVHPRPDEPTMCPVVYSIGLGKHGFPEIIAGSRLDIEMMATLVDNVAAEWLANGKAQVGLLTSKFFQDSDGKQLPLVTRYIDSEALADQSAVSVLKSFYGAMPGMVQLLLPDPDGRLPYDADYSQQQYFQPLLKELEVSSEKKH